jgi:hypothetical protein
MHAPLVWAQALDLCSEGFGIHKQTNQSAGTCAHKCTHPWVRHRHWICALRVSASTNIQIKVEGHIYIRKTHPWFGRRHRVCALRISASTNRQIKVEGHIYIRKTHPWFGHRHWICALRVSASTNRQIKVERHICIRKTHLWFGHRHWICASGFRHPQIYRSKWRDKFT